MSDSLPRLHTRIGFRILLIFVQLCRPIVGLFSKRRTAQLSTIEGAIRRREYDQLIRRVLAVRIDSRTEILRNGMRHRKVSTFEYPSPEASVLATVVVASYNYGKYIEETVRSIIDQSIKNIEVIVVDDNSTDQYTLDQLSNLEQIDSRIRVIRNTSNIGLPATRNVGISAALGEYVCCLDSDDKFEPTYLEQAISVMETDASVGFVYAWARLFGSVDEIWETRNFDISVALRDNFVAGSALFRRDDWLAVGGFTPSMHGGYDDWDFWLRLAGLGRRGIAIRSPLFLHRKHGASLTSDAHSKRDAWLARMRELNPQIFERKRLHFLLRRLAPNPKPFHGEKFVFAKKSVNEGLLVIVPWLPYGGSEALLLAVLERAYADREIVILTTLEGDNSMVEKFRHVSKSIINLPATLPEPRWLEYIGAIVTGKGLVDILSSNAAFVYAHAAELRQLLPPTGRLIDIVHNDLENGHIAGALRAKGAIDLEIAVSTKVGKSLELGGVSPENCVVIPNGIDIAGFANLPSRQDARASLGLTDEAFVVTFVGRLSPEKRPDLFLDILSGALAKDSQIHGLMIGDGPMKATLAQSIERLGHRLTTLTHLESNKMPAAYAASNLLVITSDIEGMPFVALEALASGLPVLSTDVGAIREVVIDAKNGHVFPREAVDEFTQAIVALKNDPATLREYARNAPQLLATLGRDRSTMLDAYQRILVPPSAGTPVRQI